MYLLLLVAASAFPLGHTDLGVDPAPLKSWSSSWSPSPIVLGCVNAGETTTMMFNFNPSTSVLNGVFEITHPSDFDFSKATCQPSATCSLIVVAQTVSVLGISVNQGEDSSLIIANVTLPSTPGGYGPFAVRTRHSIGGSTVDINLLFGTIGISQSKGALKAMSVSLINSSNLQVGKVGSILSFKFTVSQPLAKRDILRVAIAPHWKVSTDTVCSFASVGGTTSFVGGEGPNKNEFLCVVSDGFINIYGLNRDVAPDSKADLRISKVINPAADYTTATYVWTIETLRFGTRVVIDSGNISGPNTTPGDIVRPIFEETNGWPVSDIRPGMKIWMDVSFTTTNTLSQGSSATVLFEQSQPVYELEYSEMSACRVHNYLAYMKAGNLVTAYCYKPSSSYYDVTIANLPTLLPFTVLRISTHINFEKNTSRKQTIGAMTMDPEGNIVDKSTGLAPIQLGDSSISQKPDFFSLQYGTNLVPFDSYDLSPEAGVLDERSFILWIDPADQEFDSNTQITVAFPLIRSIYPADFTLSIPPTGVTFYLQSFNLTTTEITTTIAENLLNISPSTSTQKLGYFNFKPLAKQDPNTTLFFAAQGSGLNQISMPRFASNQQAQYNVYLATTDSAGQKKRQIEVVSFSVYPQEFESKSTFMLLCSAQTGVFPIKFSFSQRSFDMLERAGMSYYIELSFLQEGVAKDLNSGLEHKADYPYSSSGVTLKSLKLMVEEEPKLVGELQGIDRFSLPTITTVVGSVPWETECVLARLYYKFDNDQRLEYHYLRKKHCFSALDDTTIKSATIVSPRSFGPSQLLDVANKKGLTFKLNSNPLTTPKVWAFSLPTNFIFLPTTQLVDSTGNIASSQTLLTSTAIGFKLATVLIESSKSILGGSNPLALKAVKAPSYMLPSKSIVLSVIGASKWGADVANCMVWSSPINQVSMNLGSFSVTSVSPPSTPLRGPDSLNMDVSMNIMSESLLPNRTTIVVILNKQWDSLSANCTVTGLTPLYPSQPVSAVFANRACNITNFTEIEASASFSLNITSVSPPSSDSSASFIDSISAYILVASVEYKISAISNVKIRLEPASSVGNVTVHTLSAFPRILSTPSDIYLKFSCQHDIPPKGQVVITPDQDFVPLLPKTQVWVGGINLGLAEQKPGSIKLTLASGYHSGTFIEVLIETGNTRLPSSNNYKIETSWGGIIIDRTQASYALTAATNPVSSIKTKTFDYTPTTQGELAEYVFEFVNDVAVLAGDSIVIVFTPEFSEQIGSSQVVFQSEPNSYYLPCESSIQPQYGYCLVDHRKLIVKASRSVDKATSIEVKVRNVHNPNVPTTSAFKIWHLDVMNITVSGNEAFGSANLTPKEGDLELKSRGILVNLTNFEESSFARVLPEKSISLTWRIEFDLNSKHSIRIDFPNQFDVFYNSAIENCIIGLRLNATMQWDYSFTSDNCKVSGNGFTLPKLKQDVLATDYDLMQVRLVKACSLIWLYPFPESGWDSDLALYRASGRNMGLTSSFNVVVLEDSTKTVLARSYSSLSLTWLPVDALPPKPDVNSYDPQTQENRLTVSFCKPIYNAVFTLREPASNKVVCKPTIKSEAKDGIGYLDITSPTDFQILPGESQLYFDVIADAQLIKGQYSLDWTCQNGGDTSLEPYNTLLEVKMAELETQILVSIEMESGGSGLDTVILLAVDTPPRDYFIITISSLSTSVNIQPLQLNFTSDTQMQSFTVRTDIDANATDILVLNFTLTGPGERCYDIVSQVSYDLSALFEELAFHEGNLISWNMSPCLQNSCTATPVYEGTGFLYWYLSAEGPAPPTCAAIKKRVGSPARRSEREQLVNSADSKLKDMKTKDTSSQGVSWSEAQDNAYKMHLKTDWVGVDIIYRLNATLTREFYWLFPGTRYKITGCLYDGITVEPKAFSEVFSTLPAERAQPMKLVFSGKLTEEETFLILQVVAKVLQIAIEQLNMISQLAGRKLQDTTEINFEILPNLVSQGQSPAALGNIKPSTLQNELSLAGIDVELLSTDAMMTQSSTVLEWIKPPSVEIPGDNFLIIGMKASAPCKVCCTYKRIMGELPTVLQTYMGLSTNNQQLPMNCTVSSMNNIARLLLKDLQTNTAYFIACTGADFTPVTPNYIGLAASKVDYFIGQTASQLELVKNDEEDGAYQLRWAVALALFPIFA